MLRSVFLLAGCCIIFANGLFITCHAAEPKAKNPIAKRPDAKGIAFFEKKIRPVLVAHCYKCHSADALKAKKLGGELLLDTREGTHKGGESGSAVVPGDLKSSLLIEAIHHDSFEMPPKSKLPAAVISDFEKWVKMGAPDPRDGSTVVQEKATIDIAQGRKFWSFAPLKKVVPPKVNNQSWGRTAIDQFILASLESKKITPNTTASRRKLIRRLYFGLWGLPPEPSEVKAFANSKDPNAYEKMIDRLLAGKHYGERWARHWLDLARFAESNGYAFDKDRSGAYHYRDFVIKALNEDMPYKRFIRLQIAGDRLEPKNPQAHAATGFLAAGTFTSQQTQKERERSRYEQLDDIISTLGTTTLGLTLGCSRCHDHKFDPVSMKDYYGLVASFAEVGFQDYQWDPDPVGTAKAKVAFDKAHQLLVDSRMNFEKQQLPARLASWYKSQTGPIPLAKLSDWHSIGPFAATDLKKAFNTKYDPEKKVDLTKPIGKLKWTVQPTWKDGQVHNTLTGDNSANYLYRTIEVVKAQQLAVSFGRDDAIKVFLNGRQVLAKEVSGAAAADQDKLNLKLKAGTNHLLVKIVNGGGPSGFYFSAKGNQIPKSIEMILKIAADKRNPKQRQTIEKWYAPRDEQWVKLNQQVAEHLKKKPKPKFVKIYAARQGGVTYNFGANTRKVFHLARGNSNSKQGLAKSNFIQVLMSNSKNGEHWIVDKTTAKTPKKRHPRIALADWITDTQNGSGHLLARVIVNRLWQHHFGVGVVNTPSDFGDQGGRPTHPELLDYLANELIRGGWKLKPIHKMILMSSVYRQAGKTNAMAVKIDPDNKLLWRHGAQRLEAEIIRDTLLAVSGSLDKTMFGPGSLKQENPRRSVYLKVKRSVLIPFLQLFDAPDSIQSIGNRDITTVPPQALAMMNSPFVRQLAEKCAKRVCPNEKTELTKVVNDTYAITLSRPPTDQERKQMVTFIQNMTKLKGGSSKAKQMAVADYCQLMMCLNEFIFID